MAEMDQAIKRLLQARPEDILRYVLPEAQYLHPIATDVATERQLILDTLYQIRFEGELAAVNFEAQTQVTADVARRSFEYAARAMVVHELPVFSVILWLKKGGKVPQPPYEIRAGSRVLGTWNYTNVEIYNLDARDIVKTGIIGLLPLVPLMAGADRETDEAAMHLIADTVTGEQRATFATQLAIFIARQYDKQMANAIVRSVFMSTELLDESPLYRDWIETAEARGAIRGKAEGVRDLMLRVLESRFGTVDVSIAQAIAHASSADLDNLSPHVAVDSLEQLRHLLGLH